MSWEEENLGHPDLLGQLGLGRRILQKLQRLGRSGVQRALGGRRVRPLGAEDGQTCGEWASVRLHPGGPKWPGAGLSSCEIPLFFAEDSLR